MNIGQFIFDLFGGGGQNGILLCIFIIFLLDALLVPTLPELFFTIAFLGGRAYSNNFVFSIELLLTAMAAELVGIFTLYFVVSRIKVPRKVEKVMDKYTSFLLLSDERLLLLNRIAPMIPFAGAFIAICKWNPWKSAVYVALGCVLKYGTLMLMADVIFAYLGTTQAEIATIVMIFAVLIISAAVSYYYKKRKGLDKKE